MPAASFAYTVNPDYDIVTTDGTGTQSAGKISATVVNEPSSDTRDTEQPRNNLTVVYSEVLSKDKNNIDGEQPASV